MKKKYGLLKVLSVLLFLIVIATYFIKGRNGEIAYLALVDVFFDFVQSCYYFFDTILFVLVVGGFYGLLNHIPAYKQLVHRIVDKIGDKKKLFVILVTVVFAIVSALTGLDMLILMFIPFVVSIILLLGYDKLVAMSATFGATFIGIIGGVFYTLKDPSNSYATNFTSFAKLAGLEKHFSLSVTLGQCLLLVSGVVLLVLYILNHIKKETKPDKELMLSDSLFVDKEDKKVSKKKIKEYPLIIVLSILCILLVLGYLPWNDLFGIDVFNKFHTWLTGLSIGKYQVFNSLISSNITAFGTWGGLGTYMMAIFLLCFFGIVLTLIYRVKFEEAMDGVIYGIKKMIPAAIVIMFAYTVLITSYNNGFIDTIITNAGKSFGDNVIVFSLVSILGTILNVDIYYIGAGIVSPIVNALPESSNLSIYAVMFQSIYGLIQIVGPTSLLMIVGLSYLQVPYSKWLKYIWRFVVELLIAIFIVLMIVSVL